MRKYIIERGIPRVGRMNGDELCGAAATSNDASAKLAARVQWQHSCVTDERLFLVYLAEDEAAVRKHAFLSGFSADVITEVTTIIDPTTGAAA